MTLFYFLYICLLHSIIAEGTHHQQKRSRRILEIRLKNIQYLVCLCRSSFEVCPIPKCMYSITLRIEYEGVHIYHQLPNEKTKKRLPCHNSQDVVNIADFIDVDEWYRKQRSIKIEWHKNNICHYCFKRMCDIIYQYLCLLQKARFRDS